jgi:DNA N-6-adenine-methyltransferase (Dam)
LPSLVTQRLLGTNATHGLRRTNADKRRAVETLLRDEEWSKWSNREIARKCFVSSDLVDRIRKDLYSSLPDSGSEHNDPFASQTRNYTTKHGTTATMNTSHALFTPAMQCHAQQNNPPVDISTHPIQEEEQTSTEEEGEDEGEYNVPGTWGEPSEHAIDYVEEIKQRAEDTWFKERGLDKDHPEAQEALRVFVEQNNEDEDDDEEELEPRYDGEHDAYCKYCYKTHRKWRRDDDAWLCELCYYRTADEFMQIEDVEMSESQKDFYRRNADIFETKEQEDSPILDTEKERHDAHVMRVMGSSDSPEWYTPSDIIKAVLDVMGVIDLDPCSNSHDTPTVPARILYTKDDDGLSKQWKGKTYLNPPYGTVIGMWTNKLIDAYKSGGVPEAIALLPGRIDTNWFSPLYEYLICIIKGRVQFANSPYHAPFPCVLVYLGKRRDAFIKVFSSLGPIVERIS